MKEDTLIDLSTVRELLRVSEVASLLGVTQATVYRWIKAGRLRSVNMGGQLRVPPEEVQAFITGQMAGEPRTHDPVAGRDVLEGILEDIGNLVRDALAELRER